MASLCNDCDSEYCMECFDDIPVENCSSYKPKNRNLLIKHIPEEIKENYDTRRTNMLDITIETKDRIHIIKASDFEESSNSITIYEANLEENERTMIKSYIFPLYNVEKITIIELIDKMNYSSFEEFNNDGV